MKGIILIIHIGFSPSKGNESFDTLNLCPLSPAPTGDPIASRRGLTSFSSSRLGIAQTSLALLSLAASVHPLPALNVIDLLYIRRTRRCGLFQCNALPLRIPPCPGFNVRLIICFGIYLLSIKYKVTTFNFFSDPMKFSS